MQLVLAACSLVLVIIVKFQTKQVSVSTQADRRGGQGPRLIPDLRLSYDIMSAPTMQRRRSSRLMAIEKTISKPTLNRAQSSTLGLTAAMQGATLNRRSSEVTAKKAFDKFRTMEAEKPKKTAQEEVAQAKFDRKVGKFEQKARESVAGTSGVAGVAFAKGVAGKLAAFKAKEQEEISRTSTIKKTWKAGPGGGYRKTTVIDKGPAPKKSIADLP